MQKPTEAEIKQVIDHCNSLVDDPLFPSKDKELHRVIGGVLTWSLGLPDPNSNGKHFQHLLDVMAKRMPGGRNFAIGTG